MNKKKNAKEKRNARTKKNSRKKYTSKEKVNVNEAAAKRWNVAKKAVDADKKAEKKYSSSFSLFLGKYLKFLGFGEWWACVEFGNFQRKMRKSK